MRFFLLVPENCLPGKYCDGCALPMKKLIIFLAYTTFLFLVAGVAVRLSMSTCVGSCSSTNSCIKSGMTLSDSQQKQVNEMEVNYQQQRGALEEAMVAANRELAEAILVDGEATPRVKKAIENIHGRMGELQMLTLQHVFDMKSVLSPEQYKTLLEFAAGSLTKPEPAHCER